MRHDRDAIAGFFEDLPVVMVVLAGTMTLLLSCCWAAVHAREEAVQEMLRADAARATEQFLAEFADSAVNEPFPTVAFLKAMDLSEWVEDHIESEWFVFTLALVHPEYQGLAQIDSGGSGHPTSCGYSTGFLNALTDEGFVGVAKVTVLVW